MFSNYLDEKKIKKIDPIALSIFYGAKLYKRTTKYENDERGYKRPTKVVLKYNPVLFNPIFFPKDSIEDIAIRATKLKKESIQITYIYENNEQKVKEIKSVSESKDSIWKVSDFYDSLMEFQSDFVKSETYKLFSLFD